MTAGTAAQPGGAPPRQRSLVAPSTDRFDRIVRSEWTKLVSVRSTMWTLLILFAITVGFSALACWGTMSSLSQMSPQDRASIDGTSLTLSGLVLGQLAIAVLGTMVVSTEYSTGGIRSTLAAVPHRLHLLAAKGVVFAVVALVVGVITCLVSFLVGQLFLNGKGYGASLGDPHVLRAVIGGGLYVMASGMFGFALGALVRHTAAGITAAVAGLLVVPPLTNLLPGHWGDVVTKYFTSNAGQQITTVHQVGDVLGPWAGYAVFTLWWVVLLVVAGALMRRRDA